MEPTIKANKTTTKMMRTMTIQRKVAIDLMRESNFVFSLFSWTSCLAFNVASQASNLAFNRFSRASNLAVTPF